MAVHEKPIRGCLISRSLRRVFATDLAVSVSESPAQKYIEVSEIEPTSLCGNSWIQFFLRQDHANQRKFSRQSGVHRREAGRWPGNARRRFGRGQSFRFARRVIRIRADLLFFIATRVLFAEKIVFSHRLHEFPHRLLPDFTGRE